MDEFLKKGGGSGSGSPKRSYMYVTLIKEDQLTVCASFVMSAQIPRGPVFGKIYLTVLILQHHLTGIMCRGGFIPP